MKINIQILTTFLITAIVFSGVGYIANNSVETTPDTSDCPEKTFEDGWQAAKDRLEETGLCFRSQEKFTEVEGKVLSVNSDSIKVNIRPLTPLADPELDNRTLEITEETQLYKLIKISEEEFEQKMQEFEQKMENQDNQSGEERPEFPERYNKENITLNKLKEGDQIRAVSVNDKDIEKAKQFKVSEILLEP